MKIRFDPERTFAQEDQAAAALIGEGFRRIRAVQKKAFDSAKSKPCETGRSESEFVNIGNHE